MKKIAVVLSGCGVMDGSEIYESTLTLLALDKAGAKALCTAPDIKQHHVINHLSGQVEESAIRSVLQEAARLARGDITALDKLKIDDLDGAIFPGGFGAAKNSCNFGLTDAQYDVTDQVADFIQKMHAAGKPLGFLCIAPVIAAKVFGDQRIKLTIGNDPATAARLEALGSQHVDCTVEDIVVDENLNIVSTPAYMLAKSIKELEPGITKVVAQILS